MCETSGCGDPDIDCSPARKPSRLGPVEVHDRILAGNDRTARHNREHFAASGVVAINLMGSPGSGKTALLEVTARELGARRAGRATEGAPSIDQSPARKLSRLAGRCRIGAMSGDLATDHDGARLRAAGIPAVTITTGSACHLDAALVHRGLHALPWRDLDLLVIENVGNLVCPAVYDLGQAADVVVLSVTEGEDKPLKYPVMFRKANLVLVSKVDLLPHLPEVHLEALLDNLARVMPEPRAFPISARTGEGIDDWLAWLDERLAGRSTAALAAAWETAYAAGGGR